MNKRLDKLIEELRLDNEEEKNIAIIVNSENIKSMVNNTLGVVTQKKLIKRKIFKFAVTAAALVLIIGLINIQTVIAFIGERLKPGMIIVAGSEPDEDFTINYNIVYYPPYPTNSNGQTYGSGAVSTDGLAAGSVFVLPDLIRVIATNGKEGYVYQKDLEGEQPNNPSEAVEYMKRLKELNDQGIFTRTIPVYESDGITVIGEFEGSIDVR